MQTLVLYQKSDRKLIASFRFNTIVTDMDSLVTPGLAYLMTTRDDFVTTTDNRTYYVKEELIK